MSNQKQIATTIIEQMGGFGKLSAMVAAKDFMSLTEDNGVLGGVMFSFKGSRKANKCRVTLLPSDTYRMELFKINNRTFDCKTVYDEEGLYWDMLKPEFEQETGLYLSL